MKTTKILISTLLFSVLLSCTKTGPVGPAGTPGTNGNANVISNTYSVAANGWTASTSIYFTQIAIPAITQAVLDKGTVQVFNGDFSNTFWAAMPYSTEDEELTYVIEPGKLTIIISKGTATLPPTPGLEQFKVVIIPGT